MMDDPESMIMVHLVDGDDPNDQTDYSSSQHSELDDSVDSHGASSLKAHLGEDDFREELQECLDEVEYQGTFFSSQIAHSYINPGLLVKDVGTIGLPLSIRDAQAIAGICKQSPFGKGDETIVDETVRKTWELDTTEFSCRNPAWSQYVDVIASQALKDLGVQVSASAQPYKFLLYEEGAFFKAHRDTEKVPGMFGTLVICLPSEHTGGDVLLVHNKRQHTLATTSNSAFELSALAWYSDVQHEIQPVTSGYRLVLTYNLVQDLTLPKQSAEALDASDAKLTELFGIWEEMFSPSSYLIYPLEHRYTQASLSQQSLKGRDAATGRRLEKLCGRSGIYWFLAEMTKSTQDDYYEMYSEDFDKEIRLEDSVTPSGKAISLNLDIIRPEELLGDIDELCGARSADSEDEGEYTGNESMPTTYRYHYTVAVMMRKEYALLSLNASHQLPESLLAFFELFRDDHYCTTELRCDAMTRILRYSIFSALERNSANMNQNSYLQYSVMNPNHTLRAYIEVFETVSEYCYANGMDAIVRDIFKAVQLKDWAKFSDVVCLFARHIAREASNGKPNTWGEWLDSPLPSNANYTYVNDRNKAFLAVKRALLPDLVSSFQEWSKAQLDKSTCNVKAYGRGDAESLLELVPSISPGIYFESVLPCLMASANQGGIPRFLYLLGKQNTGDVLFREHIVKQTYQRLLQASMSSFKLSTKEITQRFHWITHESSYREQPYADLSPTEFFTILNGSMQMGLKNEACTLLSTGVPDLATLGPGFWPQWKAMYQFIRDLVNSLQLHKDKQLNDISKPFIAKILQDSSAYIASSRPVKSRDWSRPPRRSNNDCKCDPCRRAKAFLINPTQRVGRFSFAERTRKHLQYERFDSRDFKFETERAGIPHTLVVHKTNNQYPREFQEWQNEVTLMRSQQSEMRSQFLSTVLEGDVPDVAGLDRALAAAGNTEGVEMSSQPLQPLSASAWNRGSFAPYGDRTKMNEQVIDLTAD